MRAPPAVCMYQDSGSGATEERVPFVYSPVFDECQPFFSWPAETLTVGKCDWMNDWVCDVPWTCNGAYNMSSGPACAAGATHRPRTNVAIATPTRERISRLLRLRGASRRGSPRCGLLWTVPSRAR